VSDHSRFTLGAAVVIAVGSLAAGCAGTGNEGGDSAADTTTTTAPDTSDRFPDIVGAIATEGDDGTWRFDVTVSSPYDTPQRYADAWRIMTPSGEVLGTRELAHDHASEQPFTRSLTGVSIPPDIARVTIEGRDQANGWGGASFELDIGP